MAQRIDHEDWAEAYLAEIDRMGELTQGRVLNSVFFGGGTPSLMAEETVQAILDRVRDTWVLANDIEITLEANPTSVEAGKFISFAKAGVNRVSLGIQALNDGDLRRLGRQHSADEALSALSIARQVFDRVSFDLIYARQDQSLEAWTNELRQALDLGTDHLSLYQLTIEPGTAFGDRYANGGLKGLPPEDLSADMYEATQALCSVAGMPSYEVSNHARPGAESRHNLIYWRGGDYLGIGPGAHGRVTLNGQRYATETALSPSRWMEDVKVGDGLSVRKALEPPDIASEYLMMGLRVLEGIDIVRYETLAGAPLDEAAVRDLRDLGLIEQQAGLLRVTDRGRMVLNAIVTKLLPD